MEHITYSTLKDHEGLQFIDIRHQYDFQEGHLPGALNLIPDNFNKYAGYIIDEGTRLVFVTDPKSQEGLEEIDEDSVPHSIQGYIMHEEIDPKELVTLATIKAGDFLQLSSDYILLDVRHPDEITRPAPKKNLLNIPYEDLPGKLDLLKTAPIIYTLCGSGNRSTSVASYLKSQGYPVAVIAGGIKAIQEAQGL